MQYLPTMEFIKSANFGTAIMLSIVVLTLGFSACWAAAISEKRLHGVKVHFILGLLIPFLYPLLINSSMKVNRKDTKSEEEVAPEKIKVEGYVKVEEEMQDEIDFDEIEISSDYNEDYFKSIYLDASGNHNGPFSIDVEGNILKAEKITMVASEFMVIEKLGDGDKIQTLRIPYNKIINFSEA